MGRKYLDDIEARGKALGRQIVKYKTIVRAYDNGIKDFSLIAKITDTEIEYVKNVLIEEGRISESISKN